MTTDVRLSDGTLKRKLFVDEAVKCLSDYRRPGWTPTLGEKVGLSNYYDSGMSPSDAADDFQASYDPVYPQP